MEKPRAARWGDGGAARSVGHEKRVRLGFPLPDELPFGSLPEIVYTE